MKKQINIEAAIQEVKNVCGHYSELICAVPNSNQILVYVDQNKDGYKTLPAMANFNMVSAHNIENRAPKHGMPVSNYIMGVYETKRGKFIV
jgi:hypothetical protein